MGNENFWANLQISVFVLSLNSSIVILKYSWSYSVFGSEIIKPKAVLFFFVKLINAHILKDLKRLSVDITDHWTCVSMYCSLQCIPYIFFT